MLINLSEVFTLEGKEKTWEVPFEAKAYKGSQVEYPVVSADPVKITVKKPWKQETESYGKYFRDSCDSLLKMPGTGELHHRHRVRPGDRYECFR